MEYKAGKSIGAQAGVQANPGVQVQMRRRSKWIVEKYGPVPYQGLVDQVGEYEASRARVIQRAGELYVSLREIARKFGRDVALALRPAPEWVAEIPHNNVVHEGLDHSLQVQFLGSTYTGDGNWWIGLTDSTPTVADEDTIGSHAGWTEITDYDETKRANLNLGAVSGQSVDNSANKGTFSINAGVTVGGAFLIYSLGAGSAPGNSAVGTLYGGGAFSGGDRSLANGDTLNVQLTMSAGTA
jgi:hypothetical protein